MQARRVLNVSSWTLFLSSLVAASVVNNISRERTARHKILNHAIEYIENHKHSLSAQHNEMRNVLVGKEPIFLRKLNVDISHTPLGLKDMGLAAKRVRRKQLSIHRRSNGMKRINVAKSHRGDGPGRWHGRGPYGGVQTPWGQPPGGWGPPPWAWGSSGAWGSPSSWGSPPWSWGPPPWSWGPPPWAWGGGYNQPTYNQWATTKPLNPTRPTLSPGNSQTVFPGRTTPFKCVTIVSRMTTRPPWMRPTATSQTTSKPGTPIGSIQGRTTISPWMRPTPAMTPATSYPGATAGSIQVGTTVSPWMRSTTAISSTFSTLGGVTTIPVTGWTTPRHLNIPKPTMQSTTSLPETTIYGTTSIPKHENISLNLAGGKITTKMPQKHGSVEPDIDPTPIDASPTMSSDEQITEAQINYNLELEPSTQNKQISINIGPTTGPFDGVDEARIEPTPSSDSNTQITLSPATTIGTDDLNGNGPSNTLVSTDGYEIQIDSATSHPTVAKNDINQLEQPEMSQIHETNNHEAHNVSRPTEETVDEIQDATFDPVSEIKPDQQSEQSQATPSTHTDEQQGHDPQNHLTTDGIGNQLENVSVAANPTVAYDQDEPKPKNDSTAQEDFKRPALASKEDQSELPPNVASASSEKIELDSSTVNNHKSHGANETTGSLATDFTGTDGPNEALPINSHPTSNSSNGQVEEGALNSTSEVRPSDQTEHVAEAPASSSGQDASAVTNDMSHGVNETSGSSENNLPGPDGQGEALPIHSHSASNGSNGQVEEGALNSTSELRLSDQTEHVAEAPASSSGQDPSAGTNDMSHGVNETFGNSGNNFPGTDGQGDALPIDSHPTSGGSNGQVQEGALNSTSDVRPNDQTDHVAEAPAPSSGSIQQDSSPERDQNDPSALQSTDSQSQQSPPDPNKIGTEDQGEQAVTGPMELDSTTSPPAGLNEGAQEDVLPSSGHIQQNDSTEQGEVH